MSYFKQLYAYIKHAGYKISRHKCHPCGKWSGPIAFDGKYLIVKCTNPDCDKYGVSKYKPAMRGITR